MFGWLVGVLKFPCTFNFNDAFQASPFVFVFDEFKSIYNTASLSSYSLTVKFLGYTYLYILPKSELVLDVLI